LDIQQRIIHFVTRCNWILFGVATIAGFAIFARSVALGILFGGLLVTVNFHLLAKTLKKALTPPHLASYNVVLAKYYLRFLISGFIIFLLIAGRIVHPVGLVFGLSVVVFSIILATIYEVKKLLLKEAV
jgi:prepilin signal peptidase PulO-like enzyme (type II secretory pathway)